MLNVIILTGRLVKDPELRKSASDKSFATFTLAVDNTLKEADGTRGTCFIEARVINSDRAEMLCKYCRKGSKIAIHGSLNQRNFIRQDGSKGKTYELLVDNVEFLDPKPEQPHPTEEESQAILAIANLPDDDLPFKEEETKPQEKVKPSKKPEPKFDPYTGKPLKPAEKK